MDSDWSTVTKIMFWIILLSIAAGGFYMAFDFFMEDTHQKKFEEIVRAQSDEMFLRYLEDNYKREKQKSNIKKIINESMKKDNAKSAEFLENIFWMGSNKPEYIDNSILSAFNKNSKTFVNMEKLIVKFHENNPVEMEFEIKYMIDNCGTSEINSILKKKLIEVYKNDRLDELLELHNKYKEFKKYKYEEMLGILVSEQINYQKHFDSLSDNDPRKKLKILLMRYELTSFRVSGKTSDGHYYCHKRVETEDEKLETIVIDKSADWNFWGNYLDYLEYIDIIVITTTTTNTYTGRVVNSNDKYYKYYKLAPKGTAEKIDELRTESKILNAQNQFNKLFERYNENNIKIKAFLENLDR